MGMRRIETARTDEAHGHAHPGTNQCRKDTTIRANGVPALTSRDGIGGRREEVVLKVFRSQQVDPVSSCWCQLKVVDELKVVGCVVALTAEEWRGCWSRCG